MYKKIIYGFTLIELMVTVAIIGILAAVAIPSYTEYVQRGRLVDAHNGLATGRVRAEQYFQDNRTYVGMICPADVGTFAFVCTTTATTFLITATGSGATNGFVLTINQIDARATTGVPTGWTTPSPNNCWSTRKSGC
jgi:type IV pilus assembly protein PilE